MKKQQLQKRNPNDIINSSEQISAIEALRRNVLYAMFQTVTPDDMQEIMADTVEKAKAGDHKSKKMIMDMYLSTQAQPQNVYMQQSIVHQTEKAEFLSDYRRSIVAIICSHGPMEVKEIAETMHVPALDVINAVDHEWFEREGGRINITNEARQQIAQDH